MLVGSRNISIVRGKKRKVVTRHGFVHSLADIPGRLMYASAFAYLYLCMFASLLVAMYTSTQVCTYVCMYVGMPECIDFKHISK